MKIAIGAVVLCKILISEPSSNTISSSVTELGGVGKNASVSSNNNFITGKNSVQQTTSVEETKEVKLGKKYSSMIVGTVEDIKTVQVIKPIENSKKYKYEEQSILILKTEELEKLIVNAKACGLADDLIVDEAKEKEKADVEIKKEEAKVGESKPTKKKAKNNKKENTNKNTEEYEIIFSDQEIPAGYEEVKYEKLEKEISNKIEERANDVQKTADQIYLEELEKAQEKQRTIVVQEAVIEQETKNEEPKLIDDLKTETKVAEEEKNIKMQNDDDLDVVKLLEEQKIKELEQNNKPIVEEKKKKQPEIKISKVKKVEIEKKEQEVEKPKDKITPDNFKPSGSMMKDVIEIISN